ncbi:MAG: hypothetical protein Q9165_002298 [Trypethelium subeluteriae]
MSVARKVFDSLEGAWTIRRKLTSAMPGYPTGFLQGTANFLPRPPTAAAFDAEYLYLEQGELHPDSGPKMQASRMYVYRYHAPKDQISTWFVKDDGLSVDYLFNELQHDPSTKQDDPGVFTLKGDHLCVNDMYYASYEFRPPEDNMNFSVTYKVQGPKKDYSHDTMFEEFIDLLQVGGKANPGDTRLFPLVTLAIMLPKASLLNLRLVSKATNRAFAFMIPRLFEEIRLNYDASSKQFLKHLDALRNVGNNCQELVISLSQNTDYGVEEANVPLHKALTGTSTLSLGTKSQRDSDESESPRSDLRLPKTNTGSTSRATVSQWMRRKAGFQSLKRQKDAALPIHPTLRDISQSPRPSSSFETLEPHTHWLRLFRLLPNIATLTLAFPTSEPTWHPLGPLEKTLLLIREALETQSAEFGIHSTPHLHTLRLAPTTPTAILPLRWAGLALLHSSSSSHPFSLEPCPGLPWTSLTTLELQIRNPYARSDFTASQARAFSKILHDYLASFAATLRVLKFAWLDGAVDGDRDRSDGSNGFSGSGSSSSGIGGGGGSDGDGAGVGAGIITVGSNPLVLDLEAQIRAERPGYRNRRDFSAPAIVWSQLSEVWLGAVAVGPFTAAVMASRAPKLGRIMVLHETHWRGPGPGQIWDLDDESGWYDVREEFEEVPFSEAEALDELEKYGEVVVGGWEEEQHNPKHFYPSIRVNPQTHAPRPQKNELTILMDDEPDDTFDVDPALAASMGFSSFGLQPVSKKRKYNPALDAVIDPSASVNAKSAAANAGKQLESRPKGSTEQKFGSGDGGTSTARHSGAALGHADGKHSDGATISGSSGSSGSGKGAAGYIEKTLEQMTPKDLEALKTGIRNEKGDMVYFLPSFVEDPWAEVIKGNKVERRR